MTRYKVVSAVCLGGGRDVYVGDILESPKDISATRAKIMITQGFIVPFDPDREPDVPVLHTETHEGQTYTARDPKIHKR